MFAPLPLAAALLFAPPPDPPAEPPFGGVGTIVAGRTAEMWAADLDAHDRALRGRAVLTLRAFGTEGAEHLAAALDSEDEAVRFWAAEGLGMVPDAGAARSAAGRLRELAADGRPAERLAAAFALCRLGETNTGLPVLTDGLKHPARGVAVTAADLIARLGQPAAGAADVLRKTALTHADYHVRYRSAQALAAATGEVLKPSQVMK